MQARGVEPLNNAFVGVGFGANTYRNDVERYFGNVNLNASIDVGKWVLDAIGLQVHLAEIKGTNSKGITSFYECADFNIMVDPLKLRDPFRFENRWAFFLYAGMGLTHRKENSQQDADNDFFATVGVDVERHLYNGFFLFADLKMQVFPNRFDFNSDVSSMLLTHVGVRYKINYNPYRFHSSGESQRLREDWYVLGGLNGGAFARLSSPVVSSPSAGVTLDFGKHFSTAVEGRLRVDGGMALTASPRFGFSNASIDLMFNVMNVFKEQRNRPWNLSPYVGAGIADNFSQSSFLFSVEGGLYLRRWMNIHSDLVFDLRATVMPPRFSTLNAPGHLTFMVGWVRNLGRNTCR